VPATGTEARLLDAVDAVIAERGPSGLTLRAVGTEAGLSHTAAAHYFTDKSGLVTAYVTRAWNRVADGLDEAVASSTDSREQLMAAAVSYADFALREPSAFRIMDRLEMTNVDAPELWHARERGFFTLFGVIERHQTTGWARHREPLDLLATTWAFVHGFVELWVGGPLWAPYDGREIRDVLTDLLGPLLDGLGRRP
jgi:AcrR family transcriptional regulator